MGHYFKYLGSPEQARELWENKEALDKYLARLKELMEADETPPIESDRHPLPSPEPNAPASEPPV